ncbi:hypothetical protein SC499_20225 [Peribacillus simplex]|uniref:hypothetical protein n=1 Tax=Peribacillus simplex TaxID=1478 RepID=UPI00298E034E|nr:hypothetical protein [Peribacillus simplex]MDW7616977.1 hypothetical protein [Peribacillus simplex]
MTKKSLNTLIGEYKAKHQEYAEAGIGLATKLEELELKLTDLNQQLKESQENNASDFSDESLAKDAALRSEIASTEIMITTVKDRQTKLAFPAEIIDQSREIFELAKAEVVNDYNDRLPSLLEEIQEAKFSYLDKLVEYKTLRDSVNKRILEVGKEVNRNVDQYDFPRVKEVAFFHRDHPESEGVRYTVEKYDVTNVLDGHKIEKPRH